MYVVDRSRVVASATWWHGTKPSAGGATRERSNASASQPSRDLGTGRPPAQPCPLTFKSNDPADLHAELGKCICRGTVAKIAAIWNRAQSFHKNNAQLSQNHHACVALWRQDSKMRYSRLRKRIFGSERNTHRTKVSSQPG